MQNHSNLPAKAEDYYDLAKSPKAIPTAPWRSGEFAYATGPNYNKAWRYFDQENLQASIKKVMDILAASKLASQATPVKQALIGAIDACPITPEDLGPFDRVYADAMRRVS
ncbi:hypothetical protein BJX99DRAFT_256560 [Aspergillus californicus]